MAVLRDKPYAGMNFLVDFGDGDAAGPESGLIEVVFPDARIQMLEYRNGNEKGNEARLIPSVTRYGGLVLRRGATGSLRWYQWWNEARNGSPAVARTVVVQLLGEDRSDVVLAWKFLRAVPASYQFEPLNALGAAVLIERLELAFERMEVE